ncbi:4-hydroxy-tetrahydrodipicolinate synthase [Actinopolymorpha alba]|uniref:4-hydroxy-tetrahydrodipicolinate synthase n=1 Tax=Actinopolymorpha alba TaxID=533267 RepID=UPI0003668880|nr:4-hydroxy-tetrahydrodipicolinate synthase [Actinopolymorpha alba]
MAPSSTHTPPAPFGRILTAMVTPFTASGDLDLDAAQRLASLLVDAGNDGLVVSGTTGESPTTTDAEKDALLRAVLEAVGDRAVVVAGAGTNDTRHAIELSQHAEKAGAHGLLVVTPYYNKPPQAGLLAHFRAVADSTGLPVMLYDIPGRTGMPIATETLIQLAEHDRIVAVKDAKGDIAGTTEVLARTNLAYYSGADEWNLALFALGAVGAVSVVSHVASKDYAAMVRAVDAGDLATARAIDRRLVPAYQAIMTRSQGAIMAKAALELLGVIPSRAVRLPLVPATDEQITQLEADLQEAGLTS